MVESRWIPIKKLMREGDLLPQEIIGFLKMGLSIYSDEGVLIKYFPGKGGNEGYVYMYDPGKLPNLNGRFRTIEEFRKRSLRKCFLKNEEAILFFVNHDARLAQILEQARQNDAAILSPATITPHSEAGMSSPDQSTIETDQNQSVGIPQLDPPESLPNEPEKYNEQLIQRGFNDEAARAYMIRNVKGKWGRITNYAAMCIATGESLPGRNDQAKKDRLNSSYTERVHYGLLGKPRPKRKKASKND